MKNTFKFLYLFLVSIVLFSCEKDRDLATAQLTANAVATSSTSNIVLTKPNATQNAVTFSWSNPTYGANVAVTNQLQLAVKGTNFAAPKTVDVDGGKKSASYTVESLNALMLNLGLAPNVAADVQVRVKSTLGSSVSYSNVMEMKVTPYALISYMYAPGAYQGWDPTTANTLVSPNSNGIFVGFIKFTANNLEFKITQDKNWNVNYGGAAGNLSSTGPNLVAPGVGYYKLTVNMNNNTYTLVPYLVSIIGSATPGGWSSDTNMDWDNTTLMWKVQATFTAGEFKFRLNNDWGTNWGDDGNNGTLEPGGANIPITAGSHTIFYNPYSLEYTVN